MGQTSPVDARKTVDIDLEKVSKVGEDPVELVEFLGEGVIVGWRVLAPGPELRLNQVTRFPRQANCSAL